MGRLTDAARSQLDVNRNKAEVPEWFGKVAIVVAAFVALGLGWQLITAKDAAAPYVAPPTTTSVSTTTTPLEQAGTVADDGETVSVITENGTTRAVPAAAVALAAKIALASVTGVWTDVPVPAGYVPPANAAPATTASVLDTQYLTSNSTNADSVFRVRIDPSGTGAGQPVTKTVVVSRNANGFIWIP